MKRGNCLIALWWWARSGFKGAVIVMRSASGRTLHLAWAPHGVCGNSTWIKHRQPVYRFWNWKQMFHWFFTYCDYYETISEAEARVERERQQHEGRSN